jgi:glycyl-tRNA synthetase beta chain
MDNMGERIMELCELRAPIDDFFENVTVNDKDPKIRKNRLHLLGEIRTLMKQFADFSAIEG